MFLHIRLRIRHWSNLSEFSFSVQLSALNHSAKNIRTSEKCHQVKEAGTFFCLGASWHRNMFFCFPSYLPIEKACATKQRYYCNSLSCKLLPQLIDNSATKGFFVLTDNWAPLVFHTLARCKLRTTVELFEPFFNVLLLSHWKAQAGSNTITSPGMPTNVRTSQTPTLVRQSNWCVGCFVHTKIPYRNVARRSPLIFSIFLHQISCTRVQSISETTSHKTHSVGHEAKSPRLAPQCLAFP